MSEKKMGELKMLAKVNAFLSCHNFEVNKDINAVINSLLFDMNSALFGNTVNVKAGQDMIKTWMLPPKASPKNKSVIVIDAGGTNFRSCLVKFDSEGKPTITDLKKTSMPGIERELSKSEFFDKIADNIDYLKDKADSINFCFSYAMTITKDGDGIPNAFSKEIKAKEVLGLPVGKTLKETLVKRGWTSIKSVILMNDTLSALLAGTADIPQGTEYSSFIGFILGTGMNAAYIQKAKDGVEKQIIVCESGKCDKISLSDFDRQVDKKTTVPGQYLLEKGCSGAYLGHVVYEALIKGADWGLFTQKSCENIKKLTSLNLIDTNAFMHSPLKKGNPVSDALTCDDDTRVAFEIIDAIFDRCARYAAAILAACVIQSDEGKDPCRPVCLLCNGTTFYKTYKLKERVTAYLEDVLVRQRSIYYDIVSKENDITLGTAAAEI